MNEILKMVDCIKAVWEDEAKEKWKQNLEAYKQALEDAIINEHLNETRRNRLIEELSRVEHALVDINERNRPNNKNKNENDSENDTISSNSTEGKGLNNLWNSKPPLYRDGNIDSVNVTVRNELYKDIVTTLTKYKNGKVKDAHSTYFDVKVFNNEKIRVRIANHKGKYTEHLFPNKYTYSFVVEKKELKWKEDKKLINEFVFKEITISRMSNFWDKGNKALKDIITAIGTDRSLKSYKDREI